jgi:hypothetical protein
MDIIPLHPKSPNRRAGPRRAPPAHPQCCRPPKPPAAGAGRSSVLPPLTQNAPAAPPRPPPSAPAPAPVPPPVPAQPPAKPTDRLIAQYGSDLTDLLQRLAALRALLAATAAKWDDQIERKGAANSAAVEREVALHLERLRPFEVTPITSQPAATGDNRLDAGLAVAARWGQIREAEARREGLVKAHERKMADLRRKLEHELGLLRDARDAALAPIAGEIADLEALIARLQP